MVWSSSLRDGDPSRPRGGLGGSSGGGGGRLSRPSVEGICVRPELLRSTTS